MDTGTNANELLPKVKCTDTKCEEGLHCFRPERAKSRKDITGGNCHSCNVELVEWDHVHQRDIGNCETTFSYLKQELIRNTYFTEAIEEAAKNKILKKGYHKLEDSVRRMLKKAVYSAGPSLFRDGTQTPYYSSNLIHWAQHATATCCRVCIKYWHNIPYERDLNEEELEYLQNLIMKYFEMRIPEIKEIP